MVRAAIDGFTQVGSGGVFWTSVLTSGSISEGDGVSLAPAMPASPSFASSPNTNPRESGYTTALFLRASRRAQEPEIRVLISFRKKQSEAEEAEEEDDEKEEEPFPLRWLR